LYSFEEAIAMQSWSSASSDAALSAPAPREPKRLPEKLGPDRVARMRELVEGTDWSYRRIAGELGLSVATVSRYATEGGWRRPPAQAPSSPSESRQRIAEKLWRLAERHAEALEDQPIAQAQRALQPLARLTRTLGEMDKHAHAPLAEPDPYAELPKPRRSLHELRDELAAHLERIQREEGYGWEVREWWFESGGGI
jgi:predicted transcriptional regulator